MCYDEVMVRCDRNACGKYTDMPDDYWLYIRQGNATFPEEWTFCSWQCMSMYATENFRPSFL
jgi:hypothetical protein